MWVIAVFLMVQGVYMQVHLDSRLHRTEDACLQQLAVDRQDIEEEARRHLLSSEQQIRVQCILLDIMKPASAV